MDAGFGKGLVDADVVEELYSAYQIKICTLSRRQFSIAYQWFVHVEAPMLDG
jgi:hypothetical protein